MIRPHYVYQYITRPVEIDATIEGVLHRISSSNSPLIMEPGEDADYVKGLPFINNTPLDIHLLNKSQCMVFPLDKPVYIFTYDPDYYEVSRALVDNQMMVSIRRI